VGASTRPLQEEICRKLQEWDEAGLGGQSDAYSALIAYLAESPADFPWESVQTLVKNHLSLLDARDYLQNNLDTSNAELIEVQRHFQLQDIGLQRKRDEQFEEMGRQHEMEMDQMREIIAVGEAERIAMFEQQKQNDTEISRMIKSHFDEMNAMKREHENKIQQLSEANRIRETNLTNDVQSLASSLMERESYKPILDHKVVQRFTDLAGDVDNLTRLKWGLLQADWTNELMDSLSDNAEQLQQYILQDIVWLILYKNIFCSPFRVFGEEGKVLEQQWSEDFPLDEDGSSYYQKSSLNLLNTILNFIDPDFTNEYYTWPARTLNTERWRYIAIKTCKDTVKKRTSKLDPCWKIKEGFNETLVKTQAELSDALSSFSYLNHATQQLIEDIPIQAARLWIDMCTQRCRFHFKIPGSILASNAERAGKARTDTLQLTTLLDLKKYGDSKGQNLHKMERLKRGAVEKVFVRNGEK
jgi:hypothetical protein